MNLWIRSQNKEKLISNPKIEIIPLNNNGYTSWEIYDVSTYNTEFNLRYGYLGEYKSKDRALAVLGEIQDILCPKYEIRELEDLYTNLDIKKRETSTNYVYEMPED